MYKHRHIEIHIVLFLSLSLSAHLTNYSTVQCYSCECTTPIHNATAAPYQRSAYLLPNV